MFDIVQRCHSNCNCRRHIMLQWMSVYCIIWVSNSALCVLARTSHNYVVLNSPQILWQISNVFFFSCSLYDNCSYYITPYLTEGRSNISSSNMFLYTTSHHNTSMLLLEGLKVYNMCFWVYIQTTAHQNTRIVSHNSTRRSNKLCNRQTLSHHTTGVRS